MGARAVGIVRVSRVKGREGDSFASPAEQRERIQAACQRDGLQLVAVHEELDVSGGAALTDRKGLTAAVEAVEAGDADVVVVAYFDRLARSIRTKEEVVQRVEAAGGRVLAVDVGEVSGANAGQWLSGTLLAAVSEYVRRSIRERSMEAQLRAVERGALPWSQVPPGYVRGADGILIIDPPIAQVVVEAFQRRADGGTIAEVRAFLAGYGIERTYRQTQSMLASRVYVGEIHFKDKRNLAAHPAIVDRELWERVQRIRIPRGRRPQSDRLLARVGVLVCAGCGSRMVVGTQTQGGRQYPFYRCGRVREDCPRRVTISAELVEGMVVAAVRGALGDAEGRASVERSASDAEVALERAQQDLEAALRAFRGFESERAAVERLAELRAVRDECQERVDHLGSQRRVVTVSAATDWDRLTLEGRRALIGLVVERVVVRPGRGTGRVSIQLRGQD